VIATAKPAYLAYHIGVPLGSDGKILDTPEVARAKAAHLATQAYEAARNTLGYGYVPAAALAVYAPAITYGAPIGADGQVVDTPEVAQAKAAHLAAHAQVQYSHLETVTQTIQLFAVMRGKNLPFYFMLSLF